MASPTNTLPLSRPASWIGGIALLLVAVLAGFGYAGAILPLITSGDAAATAQAIADSETQFRIGVLCMILAAILDVVVAVALLALFEPVNRMVATAAAWFRIAYTAIFVVAIAQLASVPALLDTPDAAAQAIDAYTTIWQLGLVLFGMHLLAVGYLGFRSAFMPRILAILVAVAGAGYFADGIGTVLIAGYTPAIATVTFVGEVALIGWLLWKAIRRPRAEEATAHRRAWSGLRPS